MLAQEENYLLLQDKLRCLISWLVRAVINLLFEINPYLLLSLGYQTFYNIPIVTR